MKSGKTLWEELCSHYYTGTAAAKDMRKTWERAQNEVDKERFEHVKMLLLVQEKEAIWWRNACVLYFQTHAKMPLPVGFEESDKTLEYKSMKFPYAPGN